MTNAAGDIQYRVRVLANEIAKECLVAYDAGYAAGFAAGAAAERDQARTTNPNPGSSSEAPP